MCAEEKPKERGEATGEAPLTEPQTEKPLPGDATVGEAVNTVLARTYLTYNELFAKRDKVDDWMDYDNLWRDAKAKSDRSMFALTSDTTPYSEHWSRLHAREKEALKPSLEGKTVVDLFGGLWENGESYIRALSKKAGARQYVLQDRNLRGSEARDPEGRCINKSLGYPLFDESMKIDFIDGDGLFMAASIPDNMPNVVFFLNGVNEYNIDSPGYHAYLAWEIARALPPGGVVACSGSDAAEYFERAGLEKVPEFEEPTALWIKHENHRLPPKEDVKNWYRRYGMSRRWR